MEQATKRPEELEVAEPEPEAGEAGNVYTEPGEGTVPVEAEPSGAAVAHPGETLHQMGALVERGFSDLRETLVAKLTYDRFKEEQIERLHAELQEHKKDLLARTVRPLLSRIIRLHGDLDRMVDGLRSRAPEDLTPERFFQALQGLADDLEILLEDHGVQAFEHPDHRFDPNRQTALEALETDDEGQVGHVARRVRPGFEYGQVLLQKERVVVYRAARTEIKEIPDHE